MLKVAQKAQLDLMTDSPLLIETLFADDAPELVVAYARREYSVIEEPDGSRSAVPQGSIVESPTGRISLPQHLTAACCVSGVRNGASLRTCVELSSLARGVRILDVMVKRAPVRIRHHGRHSTGKYVILVDGDVASVEEAHDDALQHVGDALLDHMFLAVVHNQVWGALDGSYAGADERAALMVETTSVARSLEALDQVTKLVDVSIVDLQLASGIGGKGYFAIQGEQHDLEWARDELLIRIPGDKLVALDLIARPHPDMLTAFGHPGPFAH